MPLILLRGWHPECCRADKQTRPRAFQLNTTNRCWLDYTVKSMIVFHAEINTEVLLSTAEIWATTLGIGRGGESRGTLALPACTQPERVHTHTRQTHFYTNSKLSIFIWTERWLKAAAQYENKQGGPWRQRKGFDRAPCCVWTQLINNG